MNERTEELLAQLWNATQNSDAQAQAEVARLGLSELGWSEEQIEFLLEKYGRLVAQTETSAERASRARAIVISIVIALPTVLCSIGFKYLTISHSYFVISELERWFGGIVIGALSGLAVGDYRVWVEGLLKQPKHADRGLDISRAYALWLRLSLRTKLSCVVRPRSLATRLSRTPKRVEDLSVLNTSSKRLQGYLLLRFSELGWQDFWNAVQFERNLGPSKFFLMIAVFCGLLAALESISSGVFVAAVSFAQMEWLLPTIGVAVVYLPSLVYGVDTAQSSNASVAVRVLTTMGLLATCVALDLYFQTLGLPKIGLLDLF
jgi:hypothetical protein